MNNKDNENNKSLLITIIIIIIIILILCLPAVTKSINELNSSKLEYKLLQEGKTIRSDEVIEKIVEIMKNKDEEKMNDYLSDDFVYYYKNRDSKYIYSFWNNLKDLVNDNYEIERRENDIKDEETYRIYWDVVEQNKINGVNKTDEYYCLQRITIVLKRVIKKDIISYEIKNIILND